MGRSRFRSSRVPGTVGSTNSMNFMVDPLPWVRRCRRSECDLLFFGAQRAPAPSLATDCGRRFHGRKSMSRQGPGSRRGILRAMEFFETVTTQRAMRRLKPDPIPDAVLRQIMDAAICAPSGGNRQGWSFLVIRDAAKRARLGELYRESWAELMKSPYYRGAPTAPPHSREGKMVASASHLSEHL